MKKVLKIGLYIILGIMGSVIVTLLFIMLFSFICSTCIKTDEEYSFDHIKDRTNVSFKACNIINEKDTHGGFLGDGKKSVIYQCDKNFNTKNIRKKWNKLPLSENLNIYLYGDAVKNGITYPKKEENDYVIPKIENGYYYFIDNYSLYYKDIDNIYSDEKILDMGRSHNFTLTVYDIDKNYLYYYEIDT